MENIKIDEFKNFTFLTHLNYNPDNSVCAVIGSKANDDNCYNKTIFINKGDGFFPLTSTKGKVSFYAWFDNSSIIFSEIRDNDKKNKSEDGHELTCLYKISINGGEAHEYLTLDVSVNNIKILKDTSFILSATFDNNRPYIDDKSETEKENALKEHKKENDYQIIDELPYWYNGSGFTNKKRSRLYHYDGESLKPLTGKLDDITNYKISPCEQYILYTGAIAPFSVKPLKSNLHILDLKTGLSTALLKEDLFIKDFDFYGDNFFLAATAGKCHNYHEHPTFYILSNDGELNKLVDFDRSLMSSGGSDSKFSVGKYSKVQDDSYYFLSLDGYRSDIYRLCLKSGEIENFTNCCGNIDFFDINKDSIIYAAMKNLKLQEVYELKNNQITQISQFNENALKDKKLSTPEHHLINISDGITIDGWVLKPTDFHMSKKYPAILNIHGGPKTAYVDSYFHEMQYWANCGYFVMFCNPRGSDGKGNEFADIRGKYGTIDYEDIMKFTDDICAKYPQIDTDKMGVTGGSYGGFMTNWIVGHTDRFAAAATQRSISNWISLTLISDIGYFFGVNEMAADPIKDAEKMWWHSPLKYAYDVKTPTLILHSDEDYRCWISEGYQWFQALKLAGVDTRMIVFHGENHELSRSGKPDHRIRRLTEITDWMDKYLKI